MGGMKDPLLQALMEPGAHGAELRANLKGVVEGGQADPAMCIQMSELCEARGHSGLALWFLGLGMRFIPEAAANEANRLEHRLLAVAVTGDHQEPRREKTEGLAAIFAALDGLEDGPHQTALDRIARHLGDRPEDAVRLAERYGGEDGIGDSESFLGLMMLAGWEEAGERLAALERPRPWTASVLASRPNG